MTNLIVIEHFDKDFGTSSILGIASGMNNAINMRTKFLSSDNQNFEITETIGRKDLDDGHYIEIYADADGYSGQIEYSQFILNSI